jgi:hypothetical protein
MVDIAQRELEQLVREDTASIRKSKQTVIRHGRPQPHSPRMQYSLIAQVAQTGMAMNDFNLLANDDVSEDRKGGEDSWERGLAVNGPEWDVVDFEPVGQVADAGTALVCVRDDNDFVAPVDEFLNIVDKDGLRRESRGSYT